MSGKSTPEINVEMKRGMSVATGAKYPRMFDRRMLDLARGNMFPLWGVILFGLLTGLSYVAQGYIFAMILNGVYEGKSLWFALELAAVAIVVMLFRWGTIWLHDRIAAAATMRIATALRRRIFLKITELGPGWTIGRKTGEMQATIIDGVEAIESYFGKFIPQMFISLIVGLTVVVLLFQVDTVIGLVIGAMIFAGMVKPAVVWRGMGTRMRIWRVANPRLFAEYLDNLQGLFTLKSFGASERHGERLRQKTDDLLDAEVRLMTDELYWHTPFLLISAIGSAIAIVIGVIRMDAGALTVGGLLFVLLLVREATRPVNDLRQTIHFSFQGMGAAELVLDILEAKPVATNPGDTASKEALSPSVAFEGVTFRYRPGDAPALDGLSFAILEGEKVGIVGRSGAGKTTIASLLFRFFDPQEGVIKVGGQDIRSLPPERLRAMFSVVSQDTYIFHGTVRDNLLLARPEATQEELESAARIAAAHDFIVSLPEGYDTFIGERGLKLSGGERQRIAIARAVLKNAPILILDEATSSVDVASETRIRKALAHVSDGRTTIIIAHRLSTVRNADRILVLEKGRLVEEGTHQNLYFAGGAYRSLVRAEELI
jgi:ATP-binding cassette, subfamily C, bacterial CydD